MIWVSYWVVTCGSACWLMVDIVAGSCNIKLWRDYL